MDKKLYKSNRDIKISGVCAGFAEYFNVDVTLIRLIWAVMFFVGGTGLWVYIICAVVIPTAPLDVYYDIRNDQQQYNNNYNDER